jgi:hypothetical protein
MAWIILTEKIFGMILKKLLVNSRRILTLILIFIASFTFVYFLKHDNDFKILSPKTELRFEERSYDFGNIYAQEGASIYFTYYNSGRKGLKIKSVETRCGCTVSTWPHTILTPNKKDSILVKYDAMQDGYFSKEIYLFSNAETSPDVLYIRGNVIAPKADR